MQSFLTTGNITFALGVLGVMFGIYQYFKNPQIEEEKKASLLAQKVQWEKDATEKRFMDMGNRMDSALTLAQNHTHTIDVKVDKVSEDMNRMRNEIVRLATIIEERLPKRII